MFCRRNKLSLCRKIHVSKKANSQLEPAVQKFHAKLSREGKRGILALCDIANIDLTPLLFVLDDGRTYDAKVSREVWFSSGKSGLDEMQSPGVASS